MPHTRVRKFKPQVRIEPAQQHWWQVRKADVLTFTPLVAPKVMQITAKMSSGFF